MSLNMHEKELKSFAKSILMKDRKWVSVFEDGVSRKTYFILWDIFMINKVLGVKVKNDSEYSYFSETYKIDFEKKVNEDEELLDMKQLLNCAVIYELPQNSKKWEEELQKLLSSVIPSIPISMILKEKDFAKVLTSFEGETGAKKYDYCAEFEENGLDIFYAISKSFELKRPPRYSSGMMKQVVLDVEYLYEHNRNRTQAEYSSGGIDYTLGLFSQKPNLQNIVLSSPSEYESDREVGELLNCNYLLENQEKAADKFLKIAKIVEAIFQNDMLYSRYLTKDQVRS